MHLNNGVRNLQMAQPNKPGDDLLATVLADAAKDLPARARKILAAHPAAVRSALAVAANALAQSEQRAGPVLEVIGGEAGTLLDESESAKQLAERTARGPAVDVLTSDAFADRAGVTRPTVHQWLKRGRIVGWPRAKRGYLFPLAQLDERGRPYAGIDRVVVHFPDGYAAWQWLTSTTAALNGATPLSRLRKGLVDEVEAAAIGHEQGDFM